MPVYGPKPSPLEGRVNDRCRRAVTRLGWLLPRPWNFASSMGHGLRKRRLHNELAEFDLLYRLRLGKSADIATLVCLGEVLIARHPDFPTTGLPLDEPLLVNEATFDALVAQCGAGLEEDKETTNEHQPHGSKPMAKLTQRFDEAFLYASRIHGGHKRKGTSIPYIAHLMSVAALTLEFGGDEDQAIAALLHDAAEDCGGEERLDDIRLRFGDGVAAIVADCTDSWIEPKPPWRARKEAYIASLAHKPQTSLLVSLADKTHNARAIVADLRAHGEELWGRFTADRDGVLWYYGALAEVFEVGLPGALANELARAVAQMRALAAR